MTIADDIRASHAASALVMFGDTELNFTAGSVTMDARRSIVRTATLTLVPTAGLSAAEVYAAVSGPRAELAIWRGVGDSMVQLGLFSCDSADLDTDTEVISWSGSDRSKRISRARLTAAYQLSGTLGTAIAALLSSRFPGLVTDLSAMTETMTTVTLEGGSESDPWSESVSICADYGWTLYIDADGVARCAVPPDPDAENFAPVFDFGTGNTRVSFGSAYSTSHETTYSGCVAKGEPTDGSDPVSGEYWDDDTLSPTYRGTFGEVPLFYSSSLLTTEEQCTSAAKTRFAAVKGRAMKLEWSSVPNPALVPLDVVRVDGAVHILDALTLGLLPSDAMTAASREWRAA